MNQPNQKQDAPSYEIDWARYEQYNSDYIKQKSSESLRSAKRIILVGFLLLLSLTIALASLSTIASNRMIDDLVFMYEQPMEVRYNALRMNIHVLRIYVAMRDLALCTPEDTAKIESVISRAEENSRMMYQHFRKLEDLSVDRPEFQTRLAELKKRLYEWQPIRDESVAFAREGNIAACQQNVLTVEAAQVTQISASVIDLVQYATSFTYTTYQDILDSSKTTDRIVVTCTGAIVLLSVLIILYVMHYSNRSAKLVDHGQEELNSMVGELMAMDEALRQNLYELEQEGLLVQETKEKYANSLEASNDSIWEINLETGTFFASDKWSDITSYAPRAEYRREEFLAHIHPEDLPIFERILNAGAGSFNEQLRIHTQHGSVRWLSIRGKWIDNRRGVPYRLTGSVSDITKQKEAEDYTEFMAYHDSLTGLPNRANFMEKLQAAINKTRDGGNGGGVLFIDLDNFKAINDTHGHTFGDKLLVVVAERLRQLQEDDITIARFGGDEFLVLLRNLCPTEKEVLLGCIERFIAIFQEPLQVERHTMHVTASIGASVFPEDGMDVGTLLKNADAAMYESKAAGRNTFALYDKTMSDRVQRKNAIENVLHTAIVTGAARMVFQPQFNAVTNRVEGYEALMRLYDEKLSWLSPLEFIPIAEETRMIVPLGYWSLRKVMECDIYLRQQGLTHDSISVNISEIQLREPDFVENVQRIIREMDFDESRLHFEITESILLNNVDRKIEIFNQLRDLGIKIELDDFGTGYSSLNYLRTIPLDAIKIDKCFIDEIGLSAEKESLIELIIKLSNIFGATTIAEGVEHAHQVEFLRKNGAACIQGYYYSKPLEREQIVAKVTELHNIHGQQ